MPRNTLGQTGLEVSRLGLGTVKFGRNTGVKYPSDFALPSDTQIRDLLHQAQQLGINFLDTAPAYGNSEQRLGKLLKQRHDWVICTKVGEEYNDGVSHFDFSSGHVQRSIERSLKSLNTDYLDIVLIHSDGDDEKILRSSDCIDTLLDLKDKGLIRAIGMSTKTVAGGLLAAQLLDIVMVTYNPAYPDEASVIDEANKLNKGVLIKKALNSGHISNTGGNPVRDNFEFIFSKEGADSIIVGTLNPQHLASNVAAAMEAL
ncbi:MAG: aldo/keto reductase [SAR86 cluster bacterium]|uniref:Aldo/keto reductase n=1 Tax=SAR86 cluster bacterium TaxID=2030880 RepID=A0A2A4MU91_9GAMM|nr:MAG: aldo/keto reductase [SAR86 cluster bacterium]